MLTNQGLLPVRTRRAIQPSFSTAMPATNDRRDGSPNRHEVAARAAIELLADRPLTEAEWSAARARLMEFGAILRAWERTTTAPRRGNVEVLCQREP
jgi:hypothetical protein